MPETNCNISLSEFERLYNEYRPRFTLIAKSYIHDETAAEDIVADSFIYFWENKDRLAIQSSIQAYIFSSVRNGCLTWLRDKKVKLRIQQQIHTAGYYHIQTRISALEVCDPERIFATEIEEIIGREMQKMPETMRQVFLYSRFLGKTHEEISRMMNLSVRNVRDYIHRALAFLRIALKDYVPIWIILLSFNLLRFFK